jgi:hypothetical protein
MKHSDALVFRHRAETCRILARHITDERALQVLHQMALENTAKAEELEAASLLAINPSIARDA